MQGLSVCIITKNEKEKLEKCLQALKQYEVEIIVTDTGSTDGTQEMASRYVERVYEFSWCNDFAAAKNYAINQASNDIVMVIDSDEYVMDLDMQGLKEMIQEHPHGVGRIQLLNQIDQNGMEKEVKEWISRIFSKSEYEYQGKIHEQIVKKQFMLVDELAKSKAYETYQAPVVVVHDGYGGSEEQRRQKAERNINLLQEELAEYPEDPYVIYQLGKSYYMKADYAQAAEWFAKGLEYDLDPKLEYVIDMVETYGYALLNSGQAKQALLFENIYEEFGSTADFRFLMGLIYMNNELFDLAIAEFEKATKMNDAKTTGANSYLAYYNAGVICECLGRKQEAENYYEKCGDYVLAKERLQIVRK